jgi:hypothetical protein
MRTIALCIAALIGFPGAAGAQTRVDVHFDLPVILPAPVVVSPGVQVIPEVREEVFFHDGWYWVRRDEVWYRSRTHRSGWMMVPPPRVPPRLVALPPGKYRNWRAEKEERKAERKAAKRAEQRERHEEHGHGGGHGHGHGHDD